MVKVLLVDDELIARINLRCLIDWEKEGYVICGEADNALDALEKITSHNPDIIFTDMNMSGMNGVEFIKKAKEISSAIRIIAFSAFDNYEYVRQSLKEGAVDYLVKHKLDSKMLLSILSSVREEMKKEIIENERMNRIMCLASSGRVFIQKNVLKNLLNGYIQENSKSAMKEYGLSLDDKNMVVTVAQIDDFYKLKEKFNNQEFAVFLESMESIFSNLCSEMGKTEFVYLEDGKFAFIMSFINMAGEGRINSEAVANIAKIEDTVKRFLNITMSFGISSICSSFNLLHNKFSEACTVLEKGYYKGSNYIADKNELIYGNSSMNTKGLSVYEEKSIISYIRELKKELLIEGINEIFIRMKQEKASYDSVRITSIELINILQRMHKEFGIPLEETYPNIMDLYEEIKSYRSLKEHALWFKELYCLLLKKLEGKKLKGDYSPIVKKAISYILKNYDRDISLSDLSDEVHVSPQYLSKLFKEECGNGFVSYLNTVRIEQAKKMLSEGVELRRLAKKAGFKNYTYFFTVFKDNTGMTPHQYEKKNAGSMSE